MMIEHSQGYDRLQSVVNLTKISKWFLRLQSEDGINTNLQHYTSGIHSPEGIISRILVKSSVIIFQRLLS
jgi:hypothetical protein